MTRYTRKHKKHHGGNDMAVTTTDAVAVQPQPQPTEEEGGEESKSLWGKLTSMFGGGRKRSHRHKRSHIRKHKRSHRHKRRHTRKH